MQKLRCAVIGAGIVGSATAYALSRRGAEVHVFEQYDLFHNHGSSHGASRMLRKAYYEHPDYVPLVQRAIKLWRELETTSNQSLFQQTGVLLAGYDHGALIPGILRAADEHGLALEHLSHRQAAEQHEWFSFPKEMKIIKEHDAGVIFADKAMTAMLNGSISEGAKVQSQCPVQRWESVSKGVKIYTSDNTILFDRLIVTTGAWANDLLGDIGVSITPISKNLFWVAPGGKQHTLGGGVLPFAIETKDMRFFYGFPDIANEGVKLAEHTGGYPLNHSTDQPPQKTLDTDAHALQSFLSRFAPKLARPFIKDLKCLYEVSPDRHFIVDRHPQDERVCFAAGLSGHGFKFAPVLGETLADLAQGKAMAPDCRFLSLERFHPHSGQG